MKYRVAIVSVLSVLPIVLGISTVSAEQCSQNTHAPQAYVQSEVEVALAFHVRGLRNITSGGIGLGDALPTFIGKLGMPSRVLCPWNRQTGAGVFKFQLHGYSPSSTLTAYFLGGRAVKLAQTFAAVEHGEIMSVMTDLWPGVNAAHELQTVFPETVFRSNEGDIRPGLCSVYIQLGRGQAVYTVELGSRPPSALRGFHTQLYFEWPSQQNK